MDKSPESFPVIGVMDKSLESFPVIGVMDKSPESFPVIGVTELLKKMSLVISQEIPRANWDVKVAMKKLRKSLKMFLTVTEDAENRQREDMSVQLWLKRLKDVAYDAEDVLEDFSYDTTRHELNLMKYEVLKSFDLLIKKVFPPLIIHQLFEFRLKMPYKINDIKRKLDKISKEMDSLKLKKTLISSSTTTDPHHDLVNHRTPSFVDDSDIIGREDDISELVKLLLMSNNMLSSSSSRHYNQFENFSVISIVGEEGLGKTTLADLVYKDEMVQKHFEPRIWVCVPDDFDVYSLLRTIMESITQTKCYDVADVEVLGRQVQEKLTGKKYLLVLDSLLNQNVEEWRRFKSCLAVGAQGSKILVTTRLNKVASIVGGTIPPYNLQKLPNDKCWSIIKKKASFGRALESSNMKKIGEDIAGRCFGIPLAAHSLGSLMHAKREKSDWLSLRDYVSDITDSPILILRLRFDNFPTQLKQCLSFCSIFPCDLDINRETLIRLWMAEGFLGNDDESVEDIGNKYFETLLWSSFFQVVKKDELGKVLTCKMHDLAHMLMRRAANNEFKAVKVSDYKDNMITMENISSVRHMRLTFDKEMSTFPNPMYNFKNLRTFIGEGRDYRGIEENAFSYKKLRVLDVSLNTIEKLPVSIAKLRHLRYLKVSMSHVKVLHDQSISSLYNLQTLILYDSPFLQKLPKDMGSLKLLRYLDFTLTGIEMLPESISNLLNLRTLDLSFCTSLVRLPKDVGALKKLRCLDISSTRIREFPDSMTGLYDLRVLKLNSCSNIEVLPEYIGQLKHLRSLDISSTNIKVVPDSLYRLKTLKLGRCEIPKDIMNWKKLKHLIYEGQGEWAETPRSIGQLTSLQTLKEYVVREDTEFGSGIGELKSLNLLQGALEIFNIENVRSEVDAQGASLNQKQHINYLKLHWGYIPYVEDTERDSAVLEALQPHPNLKRLDIENFVGLKLPTWMSMRYYLPNLRQMDLVNCNRCKQLPALGQLPNLMVLNVHGMDSVKCFGEELYRGDHSTSEEATTVAFQSLMELTLDNMLNLEEWIAPPPLPTNSSRFSSSFPYLRKISIIRCHKLTTTPTLFPSLEELIVNCSNGKVINSVARSNLTSLTSVDIFSAPELIFLPEGLLQNNSYLQSLRISDCLKFEGFRSDEDEVKEEGDSIAHLNCSSLQSLELFDCPVLRFLPDVRGFTSLQKLTIRNCNELKPLPHDPEFISKIEDLDVDSFEKELNSPPSN